MQYIIKHAHTKLIFTANERLVPLIAAIKQTANVVKHVVYWGKAHPEGEKVGICSTFNLLHSRATFPGANVVIPAAGYVKGTTELCHEALVA